ncbi:hypothetical protein [Sphingobacterium anhuiense]|uniref:DUF4178 domain-containing protein n=1 Tax=Sphingobacterium anhuiense TaxID=493780 RepID=A0ABW5YST3_9SPHI
MLIICSKCNFKHGFDVEVVDYKGFVCSNCGSYYKGEDHTNWTFVKVFPKPEYILWTSLGERIGEKKNDYVVITKIQRVNLDGEYSNEYVGLNSKNNEIYWSDGPDYAAILHSVGLPEIKSVKEDRLKLQTRTYILKYQDTLKVVYAEGFVFEDLDARSQANTYINSINEDRFVSHEIIDNVNEYYSGTYQNQEDYFQTFEYYNEYLSRKKKTSTILNILTIGFVILIGLGFFLINRSNIQEYYYQFDQKFTSSKLNNEYIGESFSVNGSEPQKLTFQGISDVNVPNVHLRIKLVNELTNQIQETALLQHHYNEVNHACGISVSFCKVEPGTYHMVFETYSTNKNAASVYLNEDYKITFGGVDYWGLIITYVLLVLLVLWIRNSLLGLGKDSLMFVNKEINYLTVLNYKGFGSWFVILFGLSLGLQYYNKYIKTCTTSYQVNTVEDNTYTGSRYHYYRPTYSDYGSSHK